MSNKDGARLIQDEEEIDLRLQADASSILRRSKVMNRAAGGNDFGTESRRVVSFVRCETRSIIRLKAREKLSYIRCAVSFTISE